MKYIKFTYVDYITGVSVYSEPALNGSKFPAVEGLEFIWARESEYPTETPEFFGTSPDSSPTQVEGVLGVFPQLDWEQMRRDELQVRGATPEAKWEAIKVERDRRMYLGVKVGAHWYHSDSASRIQQLALVMMGAAIPKGLQWKTLSGAAVPVFVEMTQALALELFQATVASDHAVFLAGETHRAALESSNEPASYSFDAGWPTAFKDKNSASFEMS